MGSVWSSSPHAQEALAACDASHMRLASREVCDDETWANTVLNRSACSVQQRLNMLLSEACAHADVHAASRRSSSIEFAPTDMVRVFEVLDGASLEVDQQLHEVQLEQQQQLHDDDDDDDDVDSERSDDDDARSRPLLQFNALHGSLLFDTDLW